MQLFEFFYVYKLKFAKNLISMKYINLLVLLLLTEIVQAQTGPAAIGNATGSNGQPTNVIWFDASKLSLANNDNVATWTDMSGNSNNATQSNTANQPIFKTGQINGLPAIYFDNTGNQDFLLFDGNVIVNAEYTVITVAQRRSNNATRAILGGTSTSTNTNFYMYWNNSSTFNANQYNNNVSGTLVNTAEPYSGGTNINTYGIFSTSLSGLAPSNKRLLFQNNFLLGTNNIANKLSSWNGAAIGRYRTNYQDIDVAEIIMYKNALNDAQLQIIHQYLNVKYDINIYNDFFDPIAAYQYDVTGIGREANGGNLYTWNKGLNLSALSNLSNGEYIFISNNNANNAPSEFTNADLSAGVELRYNRIWYINPIQKDANINAQFIFDFSEAVTGGKYPANHTNYVLLYRSSTSGNFSQVKNAEGIINGDQIYFNLTETEIQQGYYTLGTLDQTNSPLEGQNYRTWYTLITGNWDNWEVWTLDPSGALPNNPEMLTPTTSPTALSDKVVILNGKTVTVSSNNKINNQLTVDGRLDIGTTTGHNFTTIKGTGRILLAADNFPSGDATHFISKYQGEGTVVYYGDNYNLTTAREFFNVEVELNDIAFKIQLLANYKINGSLTIKQGIFQINDNLSTTNLTIDVFDDILIQNKGSIITGSANARHQLNIYGDLTNYGIVKFTNLAAPNYTAQATDGIVDANFINDSDNQNLLCYNTSIFYRIKIDKGLDKQYELYMMAEQPEYFALYGFANESHPAVAQLPNNNNALGLVKGTVRIGVNINIPVLNWSNNYNVSENARLWIDGGTVLKNNGNSLVPYGEVKVSNGLLEAKVTSGITTRDNGIITVTGGTINTNQIRTSVLGTTHIGAYNQSGGYVNVLGQNTTTDYYVFNLTYDDNVFIMSGGTLHIHQSHGKGGIFIASTEGNYNVTGGTVIMEINDNEDFPITSRAPFWDVILRRTSANVKEFILKEGIDVGASDIDLPAQPLVALNDLTIEDNAILNANGTDVKIGRNFDLKTNGTYSADSNTTWFIGNLNSNIYARKNTVAAPLKFYNLIISKDQTWTPGVYRTVKLANTGRSTDPNDPNNTAIEILNNFTIKKGKFDTYRYRAFLRGNLQIDDGQITANSTNPGRITLNGSAEQSLKGSLVNVFNFGNIELNNSNGARLLTSIAVDNFYLNVGLMNLDEWNLDINGTISTTGTYSNTLMFKTLGDAGNGGLTMFVDLSQGVANTETIFPVGTPTGYSPFYVIQSATISKSGKFTVKPVDSYHPMLIAGNENQTVPYYWVVTISGFTNLINTDVKYTFDSPVLAHPSANKGAWYDYSIFDWDEQNNVVDSRHIVRFNYGHSLQGDFTIGNKSTFKKPKVYFTRDEAEQPDWKTNATWVEKSQLIDANGDGQIDSKDWHDSRQPAATSYPQKGDIAVIGWVPWDDPKVSLRGYPHSARWNSGNLECAEIIFTQMLDSLGNPTARKYRNNFQFRPTFTINSNGAMSIAKISGEGTIRIRDASNIDPNFSNVDLGDFVNQDSAYFLFEAFTNKTYNNGPNKYPNLFISNDGWGANNWDITINKDIIVYGNFEVRGNANYVLPTGTSGDIEIFGDLIVEQNPVTTGGAEFAFGNSGTPRNIIVHGDIILGGSDAKIQVRNSNAPSIEHNIYLEGNINQYTTGTQDGLKFWTAADQDFIKLNIIGNSYAQYTRTSGTIPKFYRIVMNKVAAGVVTFSFMNSFTLHGPTNTYNKAIELISGRLGLRDPGIDVTLTSGGGDFRIPAESHLWLGIGATARVTGNNVGVWLDGTLDCGYNTKFYCNGGTNNYIEYSASGSAKIYIHSENSTFIVGSQIRRPTTTDEGVLSFELNSATANVIIGTDANITTNDRGIFEILNNGSKLIMADNSKIIIANSQTTPAYPSVYIAPTTYNLGTGSIIQFGNSSTAAAKTIGLYSAIPLKNIQTNNASGNNLKIRLWYNDLYLDENLTLVAGTSLNSYNWDIFIKGDFNNLGEYIPNQNTTTFNGTNTQNINGATTFFNFVKNTENTLNVNSNIVVENEFKLLSGTLNDNSNEISVYGNVYNDAIHTYGGSNDGIKIVGTQQQFMYSTGQWGKITINNPYGVVVPTTANSIIVNNAVKLINGVFDIGKNLLILKENAVFIEGATYSNQNMVQTNISFTDNGIRKYFNNGYSGSLTFPIGSLYKYTPVVMDITSTDAGSIRVKAANEIHPTIVEDTEQCSENIDDINNVLHYYWSLSADNNLSNFNANVYMYHVSSDAKVTTPYTMSDYITAKLIEGSTFWNKFDANTYDQINNKLTFEFTNADKSVINGDYTAGVEVPCGGAIPDQVPAYISVTNGDWTEKMNWATYDIINHTIGLPGENVPTGGPRGAIAIIDVPHTIVMNQNYIKNYKTTINGVLDIGTTFGQRLGLVNGTGELYAERGEIPAAVYDDFILPNTGTFHFGGNSDYDILNQMPIVNNIKVSGTGQRRLPNLDLILRGTLAIDGTDNTLVFKNEFNRKIEVLNNITFNNGSFIAGTGVKAIFEISGSLLQNITGTGSFTGSNAFNHFVINNGYGLNLNRPIDIDQTLTFQNGIISNNQTNRLLLTNTLNSVVNGAGNGKFVDGVVAKRITQFDEFTFPIGNAGRYGYSRIYNVNQTNGVETYYAQYFNENPLNASMDPEYLAAPLQYVSHNEYWRINGPTGSSAYVLLRWDAISGASDDASERNDMRIAEWISANSRWEQAHTNNTASGTQTSGTITTATTLVPINNNHFFTLSTKTISENIWQGDVSEDWHTAANWSLNKIPTSTTNTTIPTNPIGARFPIVGTSATSLNLSINTSATITVQPGANFTAFGTINNNGQFILKSPSNNGACASLIDNGNIAGTGTFIIERYMTANSYHYISSPIQLGGNATSALFTRSNPSGNFNYNLYKYDETHDLDNNPATAPDGAYSQGNLALAWQYAHNGPSGADENLIPKQGYAFYTDLDQLIVFQGTPNTAIMNITGLSYTNNDPLPYQTDGNGVPQLYDGWHLVGNPYPSSIDWDLIKNNLTNIDEGIYVWDGSQYANYVNGISSGSGNLNNIIPPMQGFFVRANAPNAGFLLNNSHRTHDNTQYYKNNSNKAQKERLLAISIQANNYNSITNIYFDNQATSNYDSKLDAIAMFSYYNQVPDLYTIGSNGIKYSTNCLPQSLLNNISIPLGLKLLTSDNYTLNFQFTAGFDTIQILLQDKLLNQFIDIKSNNNYNFTHNGTDDANRFVIHFVKNNPPIVNEQLPQINTLEDELFTYQIATNTFIDNDFNDTLIYNVTAIASELPKWLTFDNNSNTLTGTPTNDNVGYTEILVQATDKFGATTQTSFIINVVNVNDAPILVNNLADLQITAFEQLFYTIPDNTFKDIDQNDKLTLSFSVQNYTSAPSFITFNPQNNTFTITPTNTDAGKYTIIVRATDLSGKFVETTFTLSVTEALSITESDIEVKIKPNPSDGEFNISTPYAHYNYEIVDASGKLILKDNSNSRNTKIDLTDKPSATYIIRIRFQDNSIVTKQLIKK